MSNLSQLITYADGFWTIGDVSTKERLVAMRALRDHYHIGLPEALAATAAAKAAAGDASPEATEARKLQRMREAGPELYAALMAIVVDDRVQLSHAETVAALAALAKAEGRS